jgi:glycosyltransferase involved in cell wall biosynthesis
MATDITVVLNCHNEGRLVHATVQSIQNAILEAETVGLKVDWLIAQDSPSEDLLEYFDQAKILRAQMLRLSCSDPGLARNAAVAAAQSKYITFIDGDDLISSNWLAAAHHFSENFPKRSIVRSEWKIYFEGMNLYIRNIDQESLEFSLPVLLEYCDWNSLAFAERETYLAVPFLKTDRINGFGFEDNTWSCDTVAAGFVNKVLPGTIHAIRVKTWKKSQHASNVADSRLALPSKLFQIVYQKGFNETTSPGTAASQTTSEPR